MQQTRQLILDTLHEKGEATVDELVLSLQTRLNHDITSVTVRHHLDVLRAEDNHPAYYPATADTGPPAVQLYADRQSRVGLSEQLSGAIGCPA